MKKKQITLQLAGGTTQTVQGYEIELQTGHKAVVHKSLNTPDWTVTLDPFGIKFANGMTRTSAIFSANYLATKLGKEKIDTKIEEMERMITSCSK